MFYVSFSFLWDLFPFFDTTAPKIANLQDFSMTAILKLRESTVQNRITFGLIESKIISASEI